MIILLSGNTPRDWSGGVTFCSRGAQRDPHLRVGVLLFFLCPALPVGGRKAGSERAGRLLFYSFRSVAPTSPSPTRNTSPPSAMTSVATISARYAVFSEVRSAAPLAAISRFGSSRSISA